MVLHVATTLSTVRLALTITVLAVGCAASEADQLSIRIVDGSGGALRVPADLDAFEVRVATVTGPGSEADLVRYRRTIPLAATEPGGSSGVAADGAVTLPQTLTVIPAMVGSTGTVRVTVLGLRSGRVLQTIERIAAFGVGRVELREFALTPLCFNIACPAGQTCESDGTCRAAVGVSDGGTPIDAGRCGAMFVECADRCIPFDDGNCGGCGVACGASERCVWNRCVCDVGLVQCGEECVDTEHDVAHCGACGATCTGANAVMACNAGTCVVSSCASGYADCDAVSATGCETALGTSTDCARCGDSCATPHSIAACSAGACAFGGCVDGWADCNGARADGCESSLTSLSSCGGCGTYCSLDHANETCSSGACRVASCMGNWDNCDGMAANGCERPLGTSSDCGGCGDACNFTNATGSCVSGICRMGPCSGGYGSCDGLDVNGCEVDLSSSNSHCGTCGRSCAEGEQCVGGTCRCPNNGSWEDARGPCLPSCGTLLGIEGAPRGGVSCCATGCSTAVVRGYRASWDCDYCCEAPSGTNGCF